ncbi:Flp1 family type IVb pilin [uncultured Solobacterium sp.]|jgi:hypothetical protein|uniref:Flp1 family type IVb pilin n=1 Tax=uncultured Solobacterium sp. TaxID=747375 RepID=UPI001CB1BF22|nr:Flp1 family type IVb pilin [uncultured Solobacterium sp.]MBF1106183.1 hypothetical protein [Solobacterium sp.]
MMDLINVTLIRAKNAFDSFMKEEKGAVDLVVIVVLIAIALVLAALFRKQIGALLDSLFETMNEKAKEAVQ